MTAFVLVAGAYTGGWVWEDVAARLRAAGAEAHNAALTGMGVRAPAAPPGTDLERHVRELVELVDRVDDPEVVLVGHDYGVHPLLGAAGRRAARITRVVHVDTGLVQEGAPALALVPDPAVHQALAEGAAHLPPPASREEWQRWGSTDGLDDATLDRLIRRAAPQPPATLTQPLRRTAEVAGLPLTGVLCAAGGSIAGVQALVELGDPRFRVLTEPGTTFFELATGHWPMLSAPGELADVLLSAAKGEGHRVARPADGELPPHLGPFLLDLPGRRRERVGRVDLYPPEADAPRPAVLFVHGGPVPAGVEPTPRDWPAFVGYARYAAGLGAVGATVDHRLHDVSAYPRAAEDLAAAVDLLRADPRVDPDRIALWFVSAGGLLSAPWIAQPPPWLRCVAAAYPILAPLPAWGPSDPRFRPAAALGNTTNRPPIVLLRVGRERPEIAATVEAFLAAADRTAADVEVIDLPGGAHGFETTDRSEDARRAVERTMRAVLDRLES
ncbi:dienelactone hydrolase family protein [Streptomyces sp. HUAS MG47]|uniref:alpha/beta hydrolase n=1 Tax=Streptomyces solicamelliae TaxID=3231716 RepID=UPI003877942F